MHDHMITQNTHSHTQIHTYKRTPFRLAAPPAPSEMPARDAAPLLAIEDGVTNDGGNVGLNGA